MSIEKIKEFLGKNRIGVISTVNDKGKPESATVAYAETDKLEIIFGTSYLTRKYKNLQKNKSVSFVVDDKERLAVQYEGNAEDVTALEEYRELHIKKNPASVKYAYNKEQRYFKIKPSWARYVDISKGLSNSFEIKF